MIKSPWVVCRKPNPQAKIRLFCFPYAGGGSAVFRTWPDQLAPDVEVCAMLFPGRETRLRETPFTQVSALVGALLQVLPPYLGKPFAFFGHSMGALVSFEVARQLRDNSNLRHLFVSARRAPQVLDTRTHLHKLPDDAFIDAVQERYGGVPEIILQNEELRALFLPLVRADMTIFETYTYTPADPLNCPITIFGGEDDKNAPRDLLAAWEAQTKATFSLQMFPGGHFFVNEVQASVTQAILTGLLG